MEYIIKEKPDDFIVKEITNKTFNKVNGKYLIYKLKKISRNTEDCIQFLSRSLRIPRKYCGFAGTKDKNAITEQFISIYNIKNLKSRVENLKGAENFSLEFIGYLDSPLSLGDLQGNKFEIIIKNIDEKTERNIPYFIVNYFDEQRFSKLNKEIGKTIIKKKFKSTVELLTKQNQLNKEITETYKQDYIKIIRTIPKKILKLFVHSYQSYLFNEICKGIIKKEGYPYKKIDYSQGELFFLVKEPTNCKVPLLGFGSEITQNQSIVDELLKKEEINLRDFIIKQIPELSSFGTERDFIVKVNNFESERQENSIKISFDLGKGSYATIVIKKVMAKY
jgi:tRNA pseudouridine13 synthase